MSLVLVKLGKANPTLRKADQSRSLHTTTSKSMASGATLSAKRICTHLPYWVRL
jgi:hypothetical protein